MLRNNVVGQTSLASISATCLMPLIPLSFLLITNEHTVLSLPLSVSLDVHVGWMVSTLCLFLKSVTVCSYCWGQGRKFHGSWCHSLCVTLPPVVVTSSNPLCPLSIPNCQSVVKLVSTDICVNTVARWVERNVGKGNEWREIRRGNGGRRLGEATEDELDWDCV